MGISMRSLPVVLLAGLLLLLPVSGVAGSPPLATVSHADGTLTVTPLVAYDHLSLRVATMPDGRLFQAEGSGGAVHFSPFAIADYAPPDGSYVWELRLTPRGTISAEVIERARRARESGDVEAEQALSDAARRAMVIRSGGFHIVAGKLVMGDGTEGPARPRGQSRGTILSPFAPASVAEDDGLQLEDQVIPDDLIVQGSLCVGFDCVNNESFGFDTIRLKENNLRIKFEDTSVGPLPDQRLAAHRQRLASGGASKFSIDDVTGAQDAVHDHGRRADQLALRRQHRDASACAPRRPCSTSTSTPATLRRSASSRTTPAASRRRPGTSAATRRTSSCAT